MQLLLICIHFFAGFESVENSEDEVRYGAGSTYR